MKWRVFAPLGCGDTFITMGGSEPKLPEVPFPITEASVVRENFGCLRFPMTLGVDFETERLEVVGFGMGSGGVGWVVQTETELRVQKLESPHCGGVTPESTATIIVVPKDAPPVKIISCSLGAPCTGPPRV